MAPFNLQFSQENLLLERRSIIFNVLGPSPHRGVLVVPQTHILYFIFGFWHKGEIPQGRNCLKQKKKKKELKIL